MRRRRFAGEQAVSLQGFSSDTLAAAQEALKQAQTGLKPDSGERLGPGTQQERDEGAAARALATPAPQTPTTTTPATSLNLSSTDISRLRSALGIDELMSALRMGGAGFGPVGDTSQFEMPQFEMPQFEMPEFEFPDFSSMFPQQQYGAPGQEPAVSEPKKAAKPKGTVVKVGSKSFNLSKAGGAGLGTSDIKAMKQKGWTAPQIKRAAAQAPKVTQAAQRTISAAKAKAPAQARTIATQAKKTVAAKRSAPKRK